MGKGTELVAEIRRANRVLCEDGSLATLSSGIDDPCGSLLRRMTLETRPKVAIEVGLAFGISTLYLLDALAELGSGLLIGMDPAQHDGTWRGGGLANVRAAGLSRFYEFHERSSQDLLPELVARGLRAQLAFIDGWHTYDHTLVDFFFVDRLLEPGGIVVLDDVGYPAIRRVCDFVLTNRAYELVEGVALATPRTPRPKALLKRLFGAAFGPLVRTDRTPDPEARRAEASIDDLYFAAFRKVSDDTRRFDHFVPF